MPSTLIESISLQNFRCFRSVTVALHPSLTVLIAPNGQGKTALLAGICAAWTPLLGELIDSKWVGIDQADMRRARQKDGSMEVMTPSRVRATLFIDGQGCILDMRRAGVAPRASVTLDAATLLSMGSALKRQLKAFADGQASQPPTLPIIAAYGTLRLWSDLEIRKGKDPTGPITSRLRGYDHALDPSANFRAFARWYGRLSQEAQAERATGRPSPHQPTQKLAAIQRAIKPLLQPTGWDQLTWDFVEGVLVAEHATLGRLPVGQLSDGIRAMIAMVADIAHRCVRLNPQWGEDAPQQTPGVVLIDEVDLHLHPDWQQRVLSGLREVFPCVQFIVTTHSPHVLSTVAAESIRILRVDDGEGHVEIPTYQTRGLDSAQVLATAMGVDPTPDVPESKLLWCYRAHIEDDLWDSTEALNLREQLIKHFGEDHPLMVDCDRLIRFQSVKRRRASTPSAS
jgi:predicted ATP-binding protein involved in virulence